MPSKRILSWSKRQSSSEPYYRTGGLLSIEPDTNDDSEAKTSLKVEKRRSSNLVISPSDDKQHVTSPTTSQHDAVVVGDAVPLQTAPSDMLRSPAPSTTTCSRSASIQKPLPRRPRSASVPSIAELPAELPGSLLLENQGFPFSVFAQPTTQIFRRESHPPDKRSGHNSTFLDALDLSPIQLCHTRSVPELSSRYSMMRPVPSSGALQFSATAQADLPTESNIRSSNKAGTRRRSRPDLITSLNIMNGKVSTSRGVQEKKVRDRDTEKRRRSKNEASPTTSSSTRSKQIDEPKGTIATQNQTIATLQSQFISLRSSHEAQVASLAYSHSAEVASLRNHIQALEEQSSNHGLHYVSRTSISSVLDTTKPPHTPIYETTRIIENPDSISSSECEGKQRSHRRSESNPEMESLKRKLSIARRPETTTRNLLPELNQYKQNNAALQQQIESLMAKLNESKQSERELRSTLGMTEMKCAEFEDKAAHADKLAKSMQALQNTIDHLENRLEIANTERLDAEEQLSNLMNHKSPFDFTGPKPPPPTANRAARDGRMSMSTVFSSASPISAELDSQENATLASFIAHIERLQDQVKEKDGRIANLDREGERLRQTHSQLKQDHDRIADSYIERLRAVERQLEHCKLLLQAEIRRHAAMSLHVSTEGEDSWPELTSLAKREDIDRWMDRLHERLRREQSGKKGKALADTTDVQMESLRQEIDFYVKEIILFKLDIKGYKSDIRKLRKITAQMEAYGRMSELESEAFSVRPPATPDHSSFVPTTPELRAINAASPVNDGTYTDTSRHIPRESSVNPSHHVGRVMIAPRNSRELDIPPTLYEMTHKDDYTIEADLVGSGASSHSVVPRPTECLTSTCDELIASFPTYNSDVPWRSLVHKRSMSEPLLGAYQTSHKPDEPITEQMETMQRSSLRTLTNRRKSTPTSDVTKKRIGRSRRPRYGLSGLLGGFKSSKRIAQASSANEIAQERPPAASVPASFTTYLRPAPSTSDTNSDATRPWHLSEREPSTASSSGMPFVVPMSSPYSPAPITPFAATMSPSCSITRNAPYSIALSTSQTGVGCTEA